MASSASSSSRNWSYDVFPSFSGEDVREGFLSHFLKELDRKSIISFIDNQIKKGGSLDPELKQAIWESKIAVVVFSNNYASSSWCLNELLEIAKCKEEWGQIVIPIFHRLDPSHVRKQTGDFGKMFKKTCENHIEEVKTRWQKALKDIANIAGFHSLNFDSEATMIEEIVSDLSRRLMYLTPSKYFEDFVGMEDHIAKMRLLLDLESKEVKMVGIWGPCGVGKTTFARALHHQLSPWFQGNVYIDNAFVYLIRQNYTKASPDDYNLKLHLQTQFLAKLLGKKGIAVNHLGSVREKLQHRKVLIVIDDLDDLMVLQALAGQNQWFGSGSRIIVITKDKQLLEAHDINCIYEVGLPSEELALEILCLSAFRTNSPPKGFQELAVEIARYADRLPLSLKVLGVHLRGKGKDHWVGMLPRLRKGLDENIGSALRVSYDGLVEEDKALFRHIACLFNLEKVNDIKLLLADSDLNFNIGLRNLVDKSLVSVRLNIVEMHTLLQQLGKEIVREQSKNPGKREFLLDSKDICYVLKHNTGTRNIIGVSLDTDEINMCRIHEDAFKAMHNLRFLKIFSGKDMLEKKVRWHIPDSFNHLPPKLKLLCWDGYPMKRLPSNFSPKSLVKLQMKNSKLKRLWEEEDVMLTCLKEMNLWGSENLKEIPDLSRATNLEKLYVGYCLRWMRLPTSIQKFNNLTNSGMLECKNLETHPSGIGKSPKVLCIRESSHLCLENLREGMQLLRMVTTLPDSLRVLFLSDIPNMVELPFSIQNLNKLTDLRITRCANLETLPTGINLESLERLNLNGCSKLRTFPDISRNISSLYLEETAIEEVPWWIQNFSKLKYLIMQRCSKLEYVYLNISKLKHLEFVNFSHCGALTGADCNDYTSCLALEAENIDSKLPVSNEASSSLKENNVAKIDFSFINCFKLDQEALLEQLSFEKLILSGAEMPLYFTHRTTGTSMAFPLLQTPLAQQFFMFKVCAVVVFDSKPAPFHAIGAHMKVKCRFKDRLGNHFDFPNQHEYFSVYQTGSHLLFLDCVFPQNEDNAPVAEVNYDYVDIKFHMSSRNSKFELKEWGIRLSKDCSSAEIRLGNSNTLREICEGVKKISMT